MANRAYLTRISGQVTETLFEASNDIPVFWLTLFDTDIVKKLEKDIANNVDDEEAFVIQIPKQIFLKNTNTGKEYFKKIYKERENLYRDFVKYLDEKFNENDILQLDILEITNLYTKSDDLLEDIKNVLENIEDLDYIQQNGLEPGEGCVHSFVGNDDFLGNKFRFYSPTYLEFCVKEDLARELYKEQVAKEEEKKKRARKKDCIYLITFGVIFVSGGIFGIIKDPSGLLKGIGMIVFGGLGLLFGILRLK